MGNNITNLIDSMKGLAGSGGVLGQAVKGMTDFLLTLEPGDIVRSDPPVARAAPIAYDLWYLNCNLNFMARYYDRRTPVTLIVGTPAEHKGDHFDYKPYMAANLAFLTLLTGLKPLKVLRDLEQLTTTISTSVFGKLYSAQYENNGIYWINTMAFELRGFGKGLQYASDGPKGYNANDYVGYLTFPIGQLGVMEVISLIQETEMGGYKFTDIDSLNTSWPKLPIIYSALEERFKPSLQSTPEVFPDMKDSRGSKLAGENYCYGRHLIESAYLVPDTFVPSQNILNSGNLAAYAPIPKLDVELFSATMKDYQEDVKPKKWMRYWIHKDSTMPVPGEFLGILCRPVACPPHVWWFQESAPFVYAGNWVETGNLTSGVVTAVTLEIDRPDHGIGNQYYVKIQGCEVKVEASDFFHYRVGDRVAVLKVTSTLAVVDKSFTWLTQPTFKDTDKLTEAQKVAKTGTAIPNYIILPLTYYKSKH